MLKFLDGAVDLAPPNLDEATAEWPSPRHHVRYRGVEVTGIEGPPASGGWLVQPAETVLALPGWEDAFETVHDGELHTLFDAEKIVRMLLHGSHLALEVLGSHATFLNAPASRSLLDWTVNRRHLGPARDSARTLREVDTLALRDILDHTRRYLQGAALARTEFSLNLDTLLDFFDISRPDSLADAREILDVVELDPEDGTLPDTPTNYDTLSQWLVAQRLERR